MWVATSLALSHHFCTNTGFAVWRVSSVEQVQQEATRNFVLSGIADRDFGDDVLEAFATMNASNVYANFRRFSPSRHVEIQLLSCATRARSR